MTEIRKKKLPSFTLQLGLAVVLCVLGSLAYWLEFSKRPADEAAKVSDKQVFALKDRPISKFEIRGENMNIVLECASLADKLCKTEDASKWNLLEPLRAQGDDTTVNSLLKNFGNLTSSEIVDLSTESPEKRAALLKDYGLAPEQRKQPARRRMSFTIAGGPRYTAYFGEKHPIGDGIFTVLETDGAVDEKKVFVVPDWQLAVFAQNTAYFRDKRLFGWNEKEVVAFSLAKSRKAPGSVEGTRAEDGKSWTLKLGARIVEGDLDAIDGFLSGVVFLTAKDFVAEKKDSPSARRNLAGVPEFYDLLVRTKTASKRVRLFAKKTKGGEPSRVYATLDDQDPLFEVDSFAVDKIEKSPAELRNARLLSPTERYALREIEVSRVGGSSFRQVAKKDAAGAWKISTPPADGEKAAVGGRLDSLLDRLAGQIIGDFAPRGEIAPAGDRLRIRFEKAEFEFWVRSKRVFVRGLSAKSTDTFELLPDLASQLPWDVQYLTDESVAAKPATLKPNTDSATPDEHMQDDGHGH